MQSIKCIALATCYFLFSLPLKAQNWGLNNTRTETRDNAGAYGAGLKSGFYQTQNPLNYPAGASGWWHMLDVRQDDVNINFAMQFAGSLFDQQFYVRKTVNDGSRVWSRMLTEQGGSASDPDSSRMTFSRFADGGWINLPISGPSGIGSNGPGQNAWIGYASGPGMWFPNSQGADICYRNMFGKMLFGNSSSQNAVMAITNNKIGIGTLAPTEVLSVVGNIATTGNLVVVGNISGKKLKITQTPWADYVFDKSYHLPTLQEVEEYIKKNHRLPEVPATAEVQANGVDLAETQAMLLKKIEELTLYVIEQQRQIKELQHSLLSSKRIGIKHK